MDREEKNINTTNGSKAVPETAIVADRTDTPKKAPDKKFAKGAFNVLNYIGLGWVANSTLSLLITYNILPTKGAQKAIAVMGEKLTPVVEAYNRMRGPKHVASNHAADKARSLVEIACMCIAGTMILFPMKWMEDHKSGIVDKIDRLRHGKKYREHPEEFQPSEQKPEDKQTWGKLIEARLLGVAACLGMDQAIEAFNGHRFDKGLPNADTMEWKLGAKLHEKLPTSVRDRVMTFFSRRGISADSIQPMVRERLQQTVGTDVKKMVMAEQTRLLCKEVSLSAVMAGMIYTVSKTGVLTHVLEKIGVKKKDREKDEKALEEDVGFIPPQLSSTLTSRKIISKPGSLFTQKIAASADQAVPTPGV